ncbi:MAG TPA: hypothetical protein VIN03_02950 [Roseateles sp.]
MEKVVSSLPFDPAQYPDQRLFIGNSPPDKGPAQAVMPAAKAVQAAKRDGDFQDILGKSLITLIYAEWDEYYRHRIAAEFAVTAKDVASDLMGDLRLVRNWVIHNKSVVQSNAKNLKVLPWSIQVDDRLHITADMFRQLADCFNGMRVQIKNVSAAIGDSA